MSKPSTVKRIFVLIANMMSFAASKRLCRLCLWSDSKLQNIFRLSCNGEYLSNKIEWCLHLSVRRDDGLSKYICSSCLYKVEVIYEFKNECERSYELQKSLFGASEWQRCNAEGTFEVSNGRSISPNKRSEQVLAETQIYPMETAYLHQTDTLESHSGEPVLDAYNNESPMRMPSPLENDFKGFTMIEENFDSVHKCHISSDESNIKINELSHTDHYPAKNLAQERIEAVTSSCNQQSYSLQVKSVQDLNITNSVLDSVDNVVYHSAEDQTFDSSDNNELQKVLPLMRLTKVPVGATKRLKNIRKNGHWRKSHDLDILKDENDVSVVSTLPDPPEKRRRLMSQKFSNDMSCFHADSTNDIYSLESSDPFKERQFENDLSTCNSNDNTNQEISICISNVSNISMEAFSARSVRKLTEQEIQKYIQYENNTDKPFLNNCKNCKKTFKHMRKYVLHKGICHKLKRCKYCNKEFASKILQQLHIVNECAPSKTIHDHSYAMGIKSKYISEKKMIKLAVVQLERLFVCLHCSRTFINQTNLNMHSEICEKRESKFCLLCHKIFNDEVKLGQHQKNCKTENSTNFTLNNNQNSNEDSNDIEEHVISAEKEITPNRSGNCVENKFPLSVKTRSTVLTITKANDRTENINDETSILFALGLMRK